MKTKQAFMGAVLAAAATVALVANAQLSDGRTGTGNGTGDSPNVTQGESQAPTARTQGATEQKAALMSRQWRLTTLEGAPILESSRDTALFEVQNGAEGARFSASAGCNRLAGGVSIASDRLTFAGNILATKMACPPDLFQQEQRFIELLLQVQHFHIPQPETLDLLDADGTLLLQFEPAS